MRMPMGVHNSDEGAYDTSAIADDENEHWWNDNDRRKAKYSE